MIYIDRSFRFFVSLSKLIRKYKQRNYRYYYIAEHRLLSRRTEIYLTVWLQTYLLHIIVTTVTVHILYCNILYFTTVVNRHRRKSRSTACVIFFTYSVEEPARIFDIVIPS